MAELVLKDMVKKAGLEEQFDIASAATSTEEIGNTVHPGTKRKLGSLGISTAGKRAVQMTASDYAVYDYLIGMDSANIRNMKKISGGDPDRKIWKLLDFAEGGDIADPWYTGNFDLTYRDIYRGCRALLKKLINKS